MSKFSLIISLLLMTIAVVISKNNNDDQAALLIDNTPLESNITCLCTEDEQCDGNTRTCSLSRSHHSCYETWTHEPSDGSIRVTAG